MAKAITRETAAQELSCSVRTIDRLRASGELEQILVGASVRILVSSLEAYIERQRAIARRRGGAGKVERSQVDVANLRARALSARKGPSPRG